ncbi:protein serine/threonine phosphatase [Saccharomycopsis crataegensis]|uniref:RNA polymerase II subunit A C-terminal domain phosphatase n=1 Tax=Saccharomycopsis crataegensis TaxID=43959 RepID=A0AAV5QKT5_9ASCO|nr:protein serine/threonine phosphatase [Saccharomycopsis crataegensis]
MSELTKLYLPSSLPYPITVTSILVRPNFEISRHTPVLKYRYLENQIVPTEKLEPEEIEEYQHNPKVIKVESIGSFESPIKGKVIDLKVKVGDIISSDKEQIGTIEEPCTHAVQFGGLCGICGANLVDEVDYSGYNNKDRAPISMSHQSTQLTVSLKEAERIEKSSRKKLLEDKKLILVVDLDQTVIQTINDPTVYHWQNDPNNPNYKAVKDIKSFSLEEKYTPLGTKNQQTAKSWYYVKLRPGLSEFLARIDSKYEMHIYTMATREYAKEIAKIIDPDGKYFGDRILSRDESGSITQKSLHRLFPTNTSMVVIIDDRGDVWQWCPNLVKVVPYDFFIGIGDINSGFLPKQNNLLRPSKRRKIIDDIEDQFTKGNSMIGGLDRKQSNESKNMNETGEQEQGKEGESKESNKEGERQYHTDNADADDGGTSTDTSDSTDDISEDESEEPVKFSEIEVTRASEEKDKEETIRDVQNSQRAEYLKALETERPLAKLQQSLDKKLEEAEALGDKQPFEAIEKSNASVTDSTAISKNDGSVSNHTLLSDDDTELQTLGEALLKINERFYDEYERDQLHPPDIKQIMPEMKGQVLGDTFIVFSGVIPLNRSGTEPDIVVWAKSFGANIETRISSKITHIISYEAKTAKIRLARTLFDEDKIKIVHPDWLFACFSNWEKVDTKEYEIYFHPQDKVSGKQLEHLKQTIYQPDEVQNYDLIENIDLSGADKELEEFLDSDESDSGSESDDFDDDKEKQLKHTHGNNLSPSSRKRPRSFLDEEGGNMLEIPNSSQQSDDSMNLSDEDFAELENELGNDDDDSSD